MILSDAYKNDILSKNTQLVPLVIIEKFISEEMGEPPFGEVTYERIFLSTHNIQVDGHYFKPLLLNMPNLSQNIDLDEGKFQTSSLTLNISNTDYNNSGRLSEELSSYSLMNAIVCIHYKSQSCNKIQLPNQSANGVVNENTNIASGCPRVFTGVIRDIQHQRDELKITIEDITDKKSPSFGRRLLGTKRKEILGELKNLSRSAQKGFDYQRKRYSGIADSFSVDFNAVVYDPFKAGMIDRIEDYVASEKPNGKKEAAKKTPRKKLDLTDVPREIKDEDGSIWTLVPGASNEAGQPVYRNSKTNRFGFKRE